jgi:hypothetical protein
MARRHLGSVARSGQTQQPAQQPLNRRLRRFLAAELRRLQPIIAKSAADTKADYYRKHFRAFSHACLLIFHGLSRAESLHQSYTAFSACRGLVALSGLAVPESQATDPSTAPSTDPSDQGLGVSYSHFAASNTTRPAAFLAGLIPALVSRVRQVGRLASADFPPDLHLFDSTFLRLSLVLSPWLPNSGPSDVPGVRLHIQYAPTLDLPEHILVSDTRTSDRTGFDQAILDEPIRLARLRGQTLAIDLGYYGHARFARLRAAEVHFVSRLHHQASYQIEADLPIQQPLPDLHSERIRVLADQRITLGSAANSQGTVLAGLRLVTAEVCPLAKAARRGAKTVRYQILTDRWNLGAADVIQLYLWRWQIELFLRWLKSHVHLPRLLGYSPNAVALTVWLAVVVHLLTVLAASALGWARRSPTLLSQLPWALAQLTEQDDRGPSPTITQLSLPLPEWPQSIAAPT